MKLYAFIMLTKARKEVNSNCLDVLWEYRVFQCGDVHVSRIPRRCCVCAVSGAGSASLGMKHSCSCV